MSQNNWLVAEFGKKWGVLANGNIGFGINSGSMIVSWEPFVYSVLVLIVATIIYLIMVRFTWLDIPFYSIIFSTWLTFFAVLVSGLLYTNPNDFKGDIWKIIVRIICISVSFVIGFFSTNFIITKISLNSKNGFKYVEKIIRQENESREFLNSSKSFKKPAKEKKTSIEVEE
ncbi:MAG: hypothetical protein ACRC4M_03090 [Mycoplasma sp.]